MSGGEPRADGGRGNDLRIVDVDTHVIEPPDLWTSRVERRFGDAVPHVVWDEENGVESWVAGGVRLSGAAMPAAAGWHEHPPLHPPRFADVDPTLWDPARRAELMDDWGVSTQVIYPNVSLFHAKSIAELDPDLRLRCVQAYNDFQVDWCAAAPGRYVAITVLPFWDVDLTLAEIERCAALGHKGIAFSQEPSFFGAPELTDRTWDAIWASAQEKQLSVNFHIASGDDRLLRSGHPDNGPHANYAALGVSLFLSNARTIAQVITGGICHRFPDLTFVSVESGIGWLPFALESLDWQWRNCGVAKEHPEYDLLPSEYFARQILGCFWFEEASARAALEILGPDNVMFETDFPHPTSMSPGPASAAVPVREYIQQAFHGLSDDDLAKILYLNAARVYQLEH